MRTKLPIIRHIAELLLLLAAGTLILTSCETERSSSLPSTPTPQVNAPSAPPTRTHRHHKHTEAPPQAESTASDGQTTTTTSSATPESAPTEPSPSKTYNVEIKRGPHIRKIALTFDAGASAKPTPMLLSILKKDDVHATFFLTGRWIEENPELVRQIAAAGYEIGNHTYSHPDLTKLEDADIRDQLAKMESLLQRTAGITSKPLFRAPYGAIDARVLRVVGEDGYMSIRWSVDSWDAFKKGITTTEIENRVLDKADDGSIVLMHCGSWPTVDAVHDIVITLRSRGYELVTVNELLAAQK